MSGRRKTAMSDRSAEGWVNYPPERTLVNLRRTRAVPAGPWEEVTE